MGFFDTPVALRKDSYISDHPRRPYNTGDHMALILVV
jgi:hypothetical protein